MPLTLTLKLSLTYLHKLVEEPTLKKCVIKGDNWSVKGPTKNLYILNAEVVLMTVPGGVFPNQWEYYGLP